MHNQTQDFSEGKTATDTIREILMLLVQAVRLHTKKFIVSSFLIFSQALFFNLVYYQYPDILANQYDLNQEQISLYMLPLSIMSFLSTLFIGPYFDKIGRRKLLLFTCNSLIIKMVYRESYYL
jgi:MFS family permease